jgi:hypothetical protein
MSAARDDWATLGGLLLGSRGIDLHDYDDLLADVPRRGQDRIVPSADYTVPRPRRRTHLRALLHIRLRGDWTAANVPVAEPGRIAQLYAHYNALKAVTAQTGLLTCTILGGTLSGDCYVEDPGRLMRGDPHGNRWSGLVVVDLTFPGGPLT